mmetsp:Transcript_29980/g.52617  ORF Transcript_29980/g.52617 Transcript_29980/m.52617 type:complete len:155 (-) Transcript_29980:86-550(-)
MVKCEHCSEKIPIHRLQSHYAVCRDYRVPYACGRRCARKHVVEHCLVREGYKPFSFTTKKTNKLNSDAKKTMQFYDNLTSGWVAEKIENSANENNSSYRPTTATNKRLGNTLMPRYRKLTNAERVDATISEVLADELREDGLSLAAKYAMKKQR